MNKFEKAVAGRGDVCHPSRCRHASNTVVGGWRGLGPVATSVLIALSAGCVTRDAAPPPVAAQMEEQSHVTELIYRLQNFTYSDSSKYNRRWAATIKELAAIGEPAVRQLIAALDETDHDVTMQSLVFTLRVIGDARAVPAMIRALPRTATRASQDWAPFDGQVLEESEESYDLRRRDVYPLFVHGRSAHEITGALEELTGYTEGKDHLRGAEAKNAVQIARVQEERRQVAARWRSWWDEHGDEVLNRGEAVLDAEPTPDATGTAVPPIGETPISPPVETGTVIVSDDAKD